MKGNFGFSLLLALCLGLLGGLGTVHAGDGVKGSAKADKLDACVAPTDFMRRNHFELIKHQRDVTVHEGIRKTDHSLAGCVDCHVRKNAKGSNVSVNSPGEFCAGCHEFAGTTLDCFTCHATKPRGN
jgi:predicted CXXCH cytochrome family protein